MNMRTLLLNDVKMPTMRYFTSIYKILKYFSSEVDIYKKLGIINY